MPPLLAILIVLGAPLGDAMTTDLAWAFSHVERTEASKTVHGFKSLRPVSKRTWLRFHVTVTEFETAGAAAASFQALVRKADPNQGLSYAWDTVLLAGEEVVHLAAPCLFSKENYGLLDRNLRRAVGAKVTRSIKCYCGGGCDFTGGPRVRIGRFEEDGVSSKALHEQVSRAFESSGWAVVDARPDYELTMWVSYSGSKTALEMKLRRVDVDDTHSASTGASLHVMHEVAGGLALKLVAGHDDAKSRRRGRSEQP